MRVQVVGGYIEFDGEPVAQLKPHAKPGELQEFIDYLADLWTDDDVADADAATAKKVDEHLVTVEEALDEIRHILGLTEDKKEESTEA